GCGLCEAHCRFDAIRPEDAVYAVDPSGCEGCGVCVRICPAQAIDFPVRPGGEWFVSGTRCGPMVHARLTPGGENSGKLVSLVREKAREIAEEKKMDLVIMDGPPGIGCPVIAAITGASMLLMVTEPTLSGAHDLERVLHLANHFRIPSMVCVNKWDINPSQTEEIEKMAQSLGAEIAGRIAYDPGVTAAQVAGKTVVETKAPAAEDMKEIWTAVSKSLGLQ
ncbi:MAG TPA: 4Fe-4S binding protein, partial [Kiritimatiellia bacterium]|nr:4Fe-4S binding protein [Kiritimatiellia bacterium]